MKFLSLIIIITIFSSACGQKNEDQKDFDALVNTTPYISYTEAIEKNPKADSLYTQRGMKLMELKQFAAAVNDFKKAYELNDNQERGLHYGASMIEAGMLKEAADFLAPLVSKYPNNAAIRERLAFCMERQNKYEDAIKLYDSILKDDPEDFATMAMKGDALAAMDRDAEAIEWYEKSYSIFPMPAVSKQLAYIYAENKNPKTVSFVEKALLEDSSKKAEVELLYAKGLYYKNIKNYSAALSTYDKCIVTEINFPYAYADKSIILFEQKQYDEALKAAIQGRKIDPQNAEMHFQEGQCLEAMGKKQDAANAYKDALMLDKNLALAQEGLDRVSK